MGVVLGPASHNRTMNGTKLLALSVAIAYSTVCAMASVGSAQVGERHKTRHTNAGHMLDPMVGCTQVAAKFLTEPVLRGKAVEAAVGYCSSAAYVKDPSYTCGHFKEAIEVALEHDQFFKKYDAESFCKSTEQYMMGLRGASRVPNTGSGPLLNFKVSAQCEPMVARAFAPDETLETLSVPDFWYAVCSNQNCAHFLPSRTKWCKVQRPPTHSHVVCEAVRKFARDEAEIHEEGEMTPKQICALYGEFVKETGIDVDAYEKVMHYETAQRLTVPMEIAEEKALITSQMIHSRSAHHHRA